MILGIYAIRDAKTEAFSQPMFFVTKGVAIRAFADECENNQSNLHKHPEDFALFELGSYNDNSGEFVSLAQPLQIALALDYKSA